MRPRLRAPGSNLNSFWTVCRRGNDGVGTTSRNACCVDANLWFKQGRSMHPDLGRSRLNIANPYARVLDREKRAARTGRQDQLPRPGREKLCPRDVHSVTEGLEGSEEPR